jgi:hypothetical protein
MTGIKIDRQAGRAANGVTTSCAPRCGSRSRDTRARRIAYSTSRADRLSFTYPLEQEETGYAPIDQCAHSLQEL